MTATADGCGPASGAADRALGQRGHRQVGSYTLATDRGGDPVDRRGALAGQRAENRVPDEVRAHPGRPCCAAGCSPPRAACPAGPGCAAPRRPPTLGSLPTLATSRSGQLITPTSTASPSSWAPPPSAPPVIGTSAAVACASSLVGAVIGHDVARLLRRRSAAHRAARTVRRRPTLGRTPWRPIAVAIRSIVAVRLLGQRADDRVVYEVRPTLADRGAQPVVGLGDLRVEQFQVAPYLIGRGGGDGAERSDVHSGATDACRPLHRRSPRRCRDRRRGRTAVAPTVIRYFPALRVSCSSTCRDNRLSQ